MITFILVFPIMAVATVPRVPAALAEPSIGFALVAAVLIGGGITVGAVNLNRALGPAIMSGTYTGLWIYIFGTVLGGLVAALLYTNVVVKATAPTMEGGDPQAGRSTVDAEARGASPPPAHLHGRPRRARSREPAQAPQTGITEQAGPVLRAASSRTSG